MGVRAGAEFLADTEFRDAINLFVHSRYDIRTGFTRDGRSHIKDGEDIVGFLERGGEISVFYTSDVQSVAKSFLFSEYLVTKGIEPKEYVFAGTQETKRMLLNDMENLIAQVANSRNQFGETK